MIIENLFNGIFGFVNLLFVPFKALDFIIDSSIVSHIISFINAVSWFIPLQYFVPILLFSASLNGYKITVSIIKTIKQILPFV
ncbi:MAG: hypothetical protein Q8900_12365 [Bacillota bacterium]|nr:hypothetical protein [Bacillota bacterium]